MVYPNLELTIGDIATQSDKITDCDRRIGAEVVKVSGKCDGGLLVFGVKKANLILTGSFLHQLAALISAFNRPIECRQIGSKANGGVPFHITCELDENVGRVGLRKPEPLWPVDAGQALRGTLVLPDHGGGKACFTQVWRLDRHADIAGQAGQTSGGSAAECHNEDPAHHSGSS